MSPRPRKTSDDDILAATARVMQRLSPTQLTLADIAKEAGIVPATLIQRFGTKRGLPLASSASAEPTGWPGLFSTSTAAPCSPGPSTGKARLPRGSGATSKSFCNPTGDRAKIQGLRKTQTATHTHERKPLKLNPLRSYRDRGINRHSHQFPIV